jgi:hypothetical protein
VNTYAVPSCGIRREQEDGGVADRATSLDRRDDKGHVRKPVLSREPDDGTPNRGIGADERPGDERDTVVIFDRVR